MIYITGDTHGEISRFSENEAIKNLNSDDYLIFAVCKKINPICAGMPFGTVVQNRKNLGLPAFETIRRTAQKLRAANPNLAGCEKVEAQRKKNEQTFKDYAKGMV